MEKQEARNLMKSFRVRKGLTQEKAAELLGIARNTLVYYEIHPYSMPIGMFVAMSELYGEEFTNSYMAQKLYKVEN